MANQKFQQHLLLLKDLGSKLQNPPSTKDSLIKILKQGATCLSELEQSPPKAVWESLRPFVNAVVKPELLKHQDREIKLLVATCICEITRITAPEAPYSDDILKDIFHLIVSTFQGLSDTSSPYFGRRVAILETLAKYRSCVVMLDLECDDLITEMFSTFFSVARDEHPEDVLTSMQTIMAVVLEESEDDREDLILNVLSNLGSNKNEVTTAARKLAMNVIKLCAEKLKPSIKEFLISSMSGDSRSWKYQIDYHEVIYDIYRCDPQILSGVVPYLTEELLTDQLDTRLKAVKLVGDLFALPGSTIPNTFQPILEEFLKRLSDRVVEVRTSVLNHIRVCLLSDPFRSEAPQIIAALGDRLMDYDENVRKQVVAVICDVACHALSAVPVETIKLVSEWLRESSESESAQQIDENSTVGKPTSSETEPGTTLSKNAQKKLLKKQRWEAKKAEKKAMIKEQKKKEKERKKREWEVKLGSLGSEQERQKLIESRNESRKKRMEKRSEEKENKFERLNNARVNGQNIVLDLEFAHLMNPPELHSLVKQIMYCYAVNGRCTSPAHLWLTGCQGETLSQLQQIPGYEKWVIEKESRPYVEAFEDQKEDLVYLTADSETELDELDPKKIYIIGGLVDRNRLKGITLKKATDQGIQTAKLPIGSYLKMSSSQVLTVNQVVEILLKYLEAGDWKESFFQVIPQRKRCDAESGEHHADMEEEVNCEMDDPERKRQCIET